MKIKRKSFHLTGGTHAYNVNTCVTCCFQNKPLQGFAVLRKKHPLTGNFTPKAGSYSLSRIEFEAK